MSWLHYFINSNSEHKEPFAVAFLKCEGTETPLFALILATVVNAGAEATWQIPAIPPIEEHSQKTIEYVSGNLCRSSPSFEVLCCITQQYQRIPREARYWGITPAQAPGTKVRIRNFLGRVICLEI